MPNTIIAAGVVSGVAAIAVGAGLTLTDSSLLQTVGQVSMLGGLANVAIAGGLALVSSQWKQFRAQVRALADVSELEMHVGQGLPTDGATLDAFNALTTRCTQAFANAKPATLDDATTRLHRLGNAIAQGMPTFGEKEAACIVVENTMLDMRLELGQMGSLSHAVPTALNTPLEPNAQKVQDEAQERSIFFWR